MANDSASHISIAHGKQGRHDPRSPVAEMLDIIDTIHIDRETLSDAVIEATADTVRDLAERHQGHRFDTTYMDEHDGAYGISTILLDTQLNVTHMLLPLYRPTSAGGHVFLRTKKTITDVIEKTHDDVPIADAGSRDLHCLAGTIRGLECIVLMPASLRDHPKLIWALDVDGIDDVGTVVVSLRLCDANGLGRSAPKLCCGKFKFLFPGAPIDTSLVPSRKRQHTDRPTPTQRSPATSNESRAVKEQLNAILKSQYQLHRDSKGLLCCVAKNFIESLGIELDESTFNTKLGALLALDPDVVVVMLGTVDLCRSIASSALSDPWKVARVMKTVTAHRNLLCDSMAVTP